MKKLLLLLLAAPAFAEPGYLTYTNDISVQTVLTQDRVDACRGRFLMFDIDGRQRDELQPLGDHWRGNGDGA